MTTFTYTGAAFGNFKSVLIKPGPNAQNPNSVVTVGLGPYLISNVGFDADALALAWNNSPNAFFQQITAASNNGGLLLTSNILGQDFEVTCTVNNGSGPTAAGIASARMVLTVLASGGTFTLTDHNSLTTGAITYSSTPATLLTRIQTAINALAGYATGDVVVTNVGDVFTLDFSEGQFAGLNIPTWTSNAGSLTGGNALTVVSETQAGNVGQSQEDELTFPIAGTHLGIINEIQTLSTNATKGTFNVTLPGYGTSATLAFSAGRSAMQAALEAIVGNGNVHVTGGPLYWTNDGNYYPLSIQFVGSLAGVDVPQLIATALSGGTDEQQLLSLTGSPTSGNFTLTFGGQTTGNLAYTSTAAQVQTALVGLSSIGAGNLVCTGHPLTVVTTVSPAVNEQQQLNLTGLPITGHYKLTFGGQTTGFLNYTDSSTTVLAALQGLSSVGSGNINVTSGPLLTVTPTSAGQDEIQSLIISGTPTLGTFTLSFDGQTTTSLPFTASTATIQSALQGLSSIGTSNIICSGGPLAVASGGTNEVERLTISGSPTSGTFTLSFGGQTTGNLAFNATASTLQTALTGLSSIGAGNLVCTGGPLATGPSGSTNEVQQIHAPAEGASTTAAAALDEQFTLSFGGQTTSTLDWTSSAATIQTALQGLSSIGSGNAVCTGGPLVAVNPGGESAGGFNEVQRLVFNIAGSVGSGTNHYTITWNGHTTGSINSVATASAVQTAMRALTGGSAINVTNAVFPFSGDITTGPLLIDFVTLSPQPLVTMDASAMNGGSFTITRDQTGQYPTWNYVYTPVTVTFQGTLANTAESLITSAAVFPFTDPATISRVTAGSAGSYSYSTVDCTFQGALGNTAQVLMTTAGGIVTVSEVTHGSTTYTYNTVYMEFEGAKALSPEALITGAGSVTTSIARIQAGLTPSFSYSYTPMNVSFQGTLGGAAQALLVDSAETGGGTVVISETTHGAAAVLSYAYNSLTIHFENTLGQVSQALITGTNVSGSGTPVIIETVHGGLPVYTVVTQQNGGTTTIQNISGGTFSLLIDTTIVTQIPYNVTAADLAARINTAFGSTVVASCIGGPAPNTAIFITFIGTLSLQPVTVQFINSLVTNQAGSVVRSVVTHGSPDPIGTNVWDLTVCPGNGTLGVISSGAGLAYAQIVLVITNTLPNVESNISEKPIGEVYLPLATISALEIETAINEALACDACRVVQVSRSQEWSNVMVPAGGTGYGGTSGDPIQYTDFWYMKDIYRITFVNKFANSSSLSIAAHFPYTTGTTQADPTVFMQPAVLAQDRSDIMDYYPEINRVVNGFVLLAGSAGPLHIASIAPATVQTHSMVGWRFKIQTQYSATGVAPTRTGLADYPSTGTIQFVWSHVTLALDGTPTYIDLLTSVTLDWNSPASVIQSVLANMLFGVGNVTVTGSLMNSWLAESSIDDPVTYYRDLKVLLTGQLLASPIDEFPYTLRCVLSNPQFVGGDSSLQKNFRIVEDLYTRSLPPHFNRRERVSIGPLTQPLTVKIGLGNQLLTIAQTATATDVQTALDSLYPLTTALTAVQNNFPVFPPKLAHAVFVYGTNFNDGPMEFEFTSLGLEGRDDVTVEVSSTPVSQVVGQLTTVVQGVSPTSEVQTLAIQGNPHAGTYTLGASGNIAYNATATTIQTDLGANPPVVAGTYPNFTLTWPSSAGTVALVATTSALNNSSAIVAGAGSGVVGTQLGGLGASLAITDVAQGVGPLYYDCPANYTPTGVPGAGDTLIIDDATSPISFGINQVCAISVVTTTPVSPATGSVFQYQRNRQVFQNNQKVKLIGAGTAPAGLTIGTAYYIVNQANNYTFQLASSPGGSALTVTTVGIGDIELATSDLVLQVYSRYSGSQIGLVNLNISTGLQEYLAKYLRISGLNAEIGIGNGTGVSMLRMDSANEAGNFQIINSGQSNLTNIPAILILCNNADTVFDQESGDTGFSFYSNEASDIGTITVHGGTLTLNNVTAALLESSSGVLVTMSNCEITDTRKLG